MDLAAEIEQTFFHTSGGVSRECPRFCSMCKNTRRIANWLRVKAGGEPVKKEVFDRIEWSAEDDIPEADLSDLIPKGSLDTSGSFRKRFI